MEQTNRTILFEEVNSEKADLLTLIRGDNKLKSLNDDDIYRIHQHLKVCSYDEFVSKFEPSVNMYLNTEDCTVAFGKNDSTIYGQRVLLDTDNSLLNTLIKLIEAKKNKKYLLKSFDDMLVNFFPISDINSFVSKRNEILSHMLNCNKKPELLEAEIAELQKQYNDGIFLLNVYLYEVNHLVTASLGELKKDKGILDDKGQMQILIMKKAKKYRYKGYKIDYSQIDKYGAVIQGCVSRLYEKSTCKHISLFTECMMLPVLYAAQEFEAIQKKYEKYIKFYMDIIRAFWKTSKPLIEVCLGIREFFSPYEGMKGMIPSLLISNTNIADLRQPKNKELLELYLNTVNTKNDLKNIIWYAIIPNIAKDSKYKEYAVRERFLAKKEQDGYAKNDIEDVMVLLEVLTKYRIQSFLSMTLTQEYTFANISVKGAEVLKECYSLFEGISEKDYCIPCFPNFTVISKGDAYQIVGKKLVYNELSEKIEAKENNILWLDGIGIGASYVAAGLIAACQCPEYLKKYFGNDVDSYVPGVSYRFSEKSNYIKTISGMLSETVYFDEEVENDLIEWSRGVLFGNRNGKMVLLTDRVFSYNRDNKLLFSMIQTMNYIERKIQYETQDFKKNLIHQFFQKRPGSIISQWYSQDSRIVNSILRSGEELEYEMDGKDEICTFHIKFNNSELVKSDTVAIFKE